jgi:uncharacterized protein (DUF952 family)
VNVVPPPSVFKILRLGEWDDLDRTGSFSGSPDDLRDGFIHLSTADQVEGTLAAHFRAEFEVVVAEVNTLGLPVVMEPSRGGKLFPHLYGTLPRAAVLSFVRRRLSGS